MEIPRTHTAKRLRFDELPGFVRALIEDRVGATVVSAASQDSGFTPGLASRLLLDDGRRVFVKAANADHEWPVADSYREEIRKVSALPAGVPVPRLRWHSDDSEWVVLCFDDIAGRPPRRPWDAAELLLVSDMLTPMAAALTPVPPGLAVDPIGAELVEEPTRWFSGTS